MGRVFMGNQEGIDALNSLSSDLPTVMSEIYEVANKIEGCLDDNSGYLGEHEGSIYMLAEEIKDILNQSVSAVRDLASGIKDLADAYQELLDDDRYGSAID